MCNYKYRLISILKVVKMAENTSRIFNLLKPAEEPRSVWDKIYDWVLSRARIVILITELLIAVAFVGKVIEDTGAKEKDKQIALLQSQLTFYSSKEPVFRDFQKRTSEYNQIWSTSNEYKKILDEVYSYIPNQGAELSIKIEKNNLTVLGYDDLTAVKELETAMKASPTFSSVIIDNLTLEQKEVLQQKGQYVLVATIKNVKRGDLQ